ncbi:hypothetical protein KQY27_01010 [Methanobrevibacter sp. TMH8]|uniref:PsbP-related protein n=1 Tax=Methanobrevibacter sp. TMH8 TaxID=2848611 RepID=UPI001CCD93E3|nr:PsbP-related protein [Methanobrevibacter sp. TMH8]MBZ9570134.1 hypothetical protein [Methanobrevibacter sp. TMH8]
MKTYNNSIISFKYGENWIEKDKSDDPFSIVVLTNNLTENTTMDISKIPINYNKGEINTTDQYHEITEKYIKNRFDSEILNSSEILVDGENACDITASMNFKDLKLEERFIGFVKNQYIYQFKIITDNNISLITNEINEIINSFIILDKSYNPPNRFNEKEIQAILQKTRLMDKLVMMKVLKKLILIIIIFLTILLITLIIGILL